MKDAVILGCPRSGTSLVLEMFEAMGWHPFFEPGMDFVANRMAQSLAEGESWAIKNPVDHWPTPGLTCDLEHVQTVAGPSTIYVWVVRHPLDAICSLRPGLADRWGHQPYPRNWVHLLTEPWHIRATCMWYWCNEIGWAAFRGLPPRTWLVVRYEDLVADPRETAAHVADWCDHTPSRRQLDAFVRRVSWNVGGPEAAVQRRWSTRDHSVHVGRWRENMTVTEIRECLQILGEGSVGRFGYEMEMP